MWKDWLKDRLKEKTTYMGLVVLLSLFGVHLGDDTLGALSTVGGALAGLMAVLMKET